MPGGQCRCRDDGTSCAPLESIPMPVHARASHQMRSNHVEQLTEVRAPLSNGAAREIANGAAARLRSKSANGSAEFIVLSSPAGLTCRVPDYRRDVTVPTVVQPGRT